MNQQKNSPQGNNISKDVSYYQDQLENSHSKAQWQAFYIEVESILKGMDKGLAILKKIGKGPEKKVLENQKNFQEILKLLEKKISP